MSSEEWTSTVTRLRRSRRGDTIHLADCKRAGNTLPWLWAEDLDDAFIATQCRINGLHPCRVCEPFAAISGPVDGQVTNP